MKRTSIIAITVAVLFLALVGGPSSTSADDLPDSMTSAECTPANRQTCVNAALAFYNSLYGHYGR
jgi:hypothetical protein